MKAQLIKKITATLAATAYPMSAYDARFSPGSTVTLMVIKSGNFAGGDLTIETDNNTDGSYDDVRAAADADAATTEAVELFTFVVGDNVRLTYAALTAGTASVYMLAEQ